MEKKNITSLLQEVIDLFGHLTTVNWSEAYTDLDIDEEFELEWGEVGHDLDTIFGDKENLTMLIDYLKAEYHAGHTIDPQIKTLRECLWMAVTLLPGIKKPIIQTLSSVGAEYCNWLDWIDRYFPPEQSKQEQSNEEPVKQDGLPFELNTEEARKYFPRAEKAGYITGHKWIGDNVRLAYFCSKVYPSNRDSQRPTTALEKFFGVKNLSAQITQIETSEPKRRTSIQWRKEIDDAIFYD
jgi:hypothetical protein